MQYRYNITFMQCLPSPYRITYRCRNISDTNY